jgi:glycosyltransferase involved in cell wall biosynthesis
MIWGYFDLVLKKIKILHVIPSLDLNDGGPAFAIRGIVSALNIYCEDVTIVTTNSGRALEDFSYAKILYFKRSTNFYKISFSYFKWACFNLRSFDVVHIHGLFSFLPIVTALLSLKFKIKYIVRPLGVLNQYGLSNKRILKMISYRLLEDRIIKNAFRIHVTSLPEYTTLKRFISIEKIFTLPLVLEEDFERTALKSNVKDLGVSEVLFLYLGRINRIKQIEIVINLVSELYQINSLVRLTIMGNGDLEYLKDLKILVSNLSLDNVVKFRNAEFGEEKHNILSSSHYLVSASLSENFGLSFLEGLSYGLPCLAFPEIGISDLLIKNNAGLYINDIQQQAAVKRSLFNNDAYRELVKTTRLIYHQEFSRLVLSRKLIDLYYDMLKD